MKVCYGEPCSSCATKGIYQPAGDIKMLSTEQIAKNVADIMAREQEYMSAKMFSLYPTALPCDFVIEQQKVGDEIRVSVNFKDVETYHRLMNERSAKPTIPDSAVVERFNELVKEGKIEYFPACNQWATADYKYRLRPTPRYRPYNSTDEFKLADFCGKIVRRIGGKDGYIIMSVGLDRICLEGAPSYSWQAMFEMFVWDSTGEPFGVRIEK